MVISLSTISEGDWVELRDVSGNRIEASAHVDGLDRDQLYAVAFGTRLYFARRTAAGWQRVSGIVVSAHQPPLAYDEL